MLVAYEVQYQVLQNFERLHDRDNMDTATANIAGAMTATVVACILAILVDKARKAYYGWCFRGALHAPRGAQARARGIVREPRR